MTYTVVWHPTAIDALAVLWNAGPDRAAIAATADYFDQTLKHDASSQGESREDDTRILICEPLAIYFRVSEQDRQVSVDVVWRCTS